MRERLFRVIWRLEEEDWHSTRPLMVALRDIVENATVPEVTTVLSAFEERRPK